MSRPWTREQIAFVKANPWMDEDKLQAGVNERGPKRSWGAVREQRWKLGFRREATAEDRAKGGLKGSSMAEGWPIMEGSEEERHDRYCELVWSEFKRLYPEKVAA